MENIFSFKRKKNCKHAQANTSLHVLYEKSKLKENSNFNITTKGCFISNMA